MYKTNIELSVDTIPELRASLTSDQQLVTTFNALVSESEELLHKISLLNDKTKLSFMEDHDGEKLSQRINKLKPVFIKIKDRETPLPEE